MVMSEARVAQRYTGETPVLQGPNLTTRTELNHKDNYQAEGGYFRRNRPFWLASQHHDG